jgi:transaldolase
MKAQVSSCPRHDSAVANAVAEFCKKQKPAQKNARSSFKSEPAWVDLHATGTELWLDTGDVEAIRQLWTREFVALTTNNTLLNKEVQKGIYDKLVPDAAKVIKAADPKLSQDLLVQEIAFVLNAVHGQMLVQSFDADVSVELHTNLAWDTEASYQYGKRFAAISPDRFIVKVPLTPEGVFAARRLRADGIRVNFTLGFSARQNYLIAVAARPNWVNVFMGRCNAFVADNKLGDGANVGEKATLASQRVLRKLRKEQKLEVRQIGASMRSGQQAIDLMGLDVYTMPTTVAHEYLARPPKKGEVRDRTQADPEVKLDGARTVQGEKLDALWAISAEMNTAMCALLAEELDSMTGAELRAFLADHRVGDLFPELSEPDRALITKHGKIPQHAPWARRVAAGTASWDGLLTESALLSFASDQQKLDDRIRSHL